MSGNGLNRTKGVFDIAKEASIAVNIAIDSLMGLKIIGNKEADRAVEIGIKIFLLFRETTGRSSTHGSVDIKVESKKLANILIAALTEEGIVKEQDVRRAVEVAAEELLVRWSMESW
jgi:hypothetical protein